jgi:hypothetical protein
MMPAFVITGLCGATVVACLVTGFAVLAVVALVLWCAARVAT